MGRWLNRIHLSGKLAIILIAGFFLPMFLLTAITVNRLQTTSRQARMQEMQRALEHVRDQSDTLFSQAVALSLNMVTDTTLNSLLDKNYASPYSFLIPYQEVIQNKLEVSPAYSAIGKIVVYTDNPTVISGKAVSYIGTVDFILGDSSALLSPWPSSPDLFFRVAEDNGSLISPERDISLIRNMNLIPAAQQYHRILQVSMNLSALSAVLEDSDPFDSILLADTANHVFISSVPGYGLQDFDPDQLKEGDRMLELGLSSCPSLRLVAIYPASALTKEFARILSPYLILSLLLGILGLIFSGWIARNITRRLQIIGRHTQGIAEGRFGSLDESRMGEDEVGLLARDIDQMSRQLEAYIQKEYLNELQHAQLQREKATAELHALQSQVNPHFMFNALEAIRLKAKARGETETARMITYMSRMFRRLLDWHEDLIPLREELAFIQEFLAIQKYRYDHSFSFDVQAEEELLDNYIPKMLIQPLVENACVHGLWTDDDTRNAGLFITREGDQMRVIVADHGEGMSEERLAEVRQLLRDGNNRMHSVGLNNVLVRCRLYYGNEASMDVEPGQSEGTIFTLIVPLRWRKEDFHVSGSDRG